MRKVKKVALPVWVKRRNLSNEKEGDGKRKRSAARLAGCHPKTAPPAERAGDRAGATSCARTTSYARTSRHAQVQVAARSMRLPAIADAHCHYWTPGTHRWLLEVPLKLRPLCRDYLPTTQMEDLTGLDLRETVYIQSNMHAAGEFSEQLELDGLLQTLQLQNLTDLVGALEATGLDERIRGGNWSLMAPRTL